MPEARISIIIPVLNEASVINRTLAQFVDMPGTNTPEIIVVDGEENAGTINAIKNKSVKAVLTSKGRGLQMNRGAEIASGDILLFLHADTILPSNALKKIQSALDEAPGSYGAFGLGIDGVKPAYRLIEGMVGIRTRITGIPYGDQAIFLKKALFDSVGGYPEIPIMEDVALTQRLKRRNTRIILISDKVRTSARRWETEGILYCTIRNWLLVTCFLCGANPKVLAKYYRST